MDLQAPLHRDDLDLEALQQLAATLGRTLRAQAEGAGCVLGLDGALGAGKTTFVRWLAQGLEIPPGERIVSPTFTVVREHPIPAWGEDGRLLHIDAYRLQHPDDLFALGFDEMWGSRCVTCVEWAERVAAALPEDRLMLTIEACAPRAAPAPGGVPEAPRRLTLEALGPKSAALQHAFEAALA